MRFLLVFFIFLGFSQTMLVAEAISLLPQNSFDRPVVNEINGQPASQNINKAPDRILQNGGYAQSEETRKDEERQILLFERP